MNKAVLAAVCEKSKKKEFESSLAECRELCRACGIEVCACVTQQSDTVDLNTAFRSGKLEELARTAEQTQADGIVFYNPLHVKTAERISAACSDIEVIDRTALILYIFSKRACSAQAKIQTEMARLQYDLPKLLQDSAEGSHARGGSVNNRGAGEMRSAVIQRRYQARISELKRQLKQIDAHHLDQEEKRNSSLLKRAALVGYTNAGKSSLMNAMLRYGSRDDKQVLEKDMLFATLDTSIRSITYHSRQFLLYDTVGFVSDLPHELVEAFKSTLDAARYADLLIQVIDASDPEWQIKAAVTEETLKQIHAEHIPVIRVFNKMDLVKDTESFPGICISCLKKEGLDDLIQQIVNTLYPAEVSLECCIPYDHMALIDQGRKTMEIRILDQDETGMHIMVSGPKAQTELFRPYEVHPAKEK